MLGLLVSQNDQLLSYRALDAMAHVQVEQFDIHTPALTIREAFSFSAALRLMDVSVEQREDFVDEVTAKPALLGVTFLAYGPKGPLKWLC